MEKSKLQMSLRMRSLHEYDCMQEIEEGGG